MSVDVMNSKTETKLILGRNHRMTASEVADFMAKIDSYLSGWWPESESCFSPDSADESELDEWEQCCGWTLITEDGEFEAVAVSDQGIRFRKSDYLIWRKANI